MTTWTGNNKDKTRTTKFRSSVSQDYRIAVVNGDTGGTLTCSNLSTLDNAYCFGWRVTGPTPIAVTWRISGNTVVAAHDNPGENATVYIKVWGKR